MRGKMDCHGASDIGLKRKINQDQFLVADLNKSMRIHLSSLSIDDHETLFGACHGKLLAVADGMGGHAAGEQASRLALETITTYVLNTMPWFYRLTEEGNSDFRDELCESLARCQERLGIDVAARPEREGMGTTLTLAYILWPRMFVVHVGDSRCYVKRQSELRQITTDHTVAQQFLDAGTLQPDEIGPIWHNTLWNVLGGEKDYVSPDVEKAELKIGDTVLLCSDGLNKHVDDTRIAEVLEEDCSAETMCNKLIEEARQDGGTDNITVIVSRFVGTNDETDLAIESADKSYEAEFDPMADTLPMGEQELVESQPATD